MATKDDLKVLEVKMEAYIHEVGDGIIAMVDHRFNDVDQKLDKIHQRLDSLEDLIKSPQPDSYLVKESSKPGRRWYEPGDARREFVAIMAKKGIKWPDKYRKPLDKTVP